MRLGEWFASPTRVYMGGDSTPFPIFVVSSRTATGSKEWCCDQRSIVCSMEKFWFGWLCVDTSVSRLSLLVYSFAVRSCNCQWIAWLSVAMHACSRSLDSSCVSSRSKQLQVSGATRELKLLCRLCPWMSWWWPGDLFEEASENNEFVWASVGHDSCTLRCGPPCQTYGCFL